MSRSRCKLHFYGCGFCLMSYDIGPVVIITCVHFWILTCVHFWIRVMIIAGLVH